MYSQQQNQLYDQYIQQSFQNQNTINQPVKTNIGTEDVREIVQRLNSQPFNENYTLVTFDELTTAELLLLLQKIFTYLNSEYAKLRERPQEEIVQEVIQFLRILNYPVPQPPQDANFQTGLFQGDKRIIYPVLYYLTTRLKELEKRAYLARFLVPFQVPEEIPVDEIMKQHIDQYKDLQAEFQVNHQQYESAQSESNNPNELKKEIVQLEQEREQLIGKINTFKGKNTNKPEFQALLEVTNLLRREQEEEARIADKLRQQRQQLEWTDQQLLASQQRLIDTKKQMAPDNTPEQMLMSLRNEVKKNRELCYERLQIEINEKKKKLQQTEQLLNDPPITQNEITQLENQVVVLRRTVAVMEEKISKQNPQDDKLAIYKQQAALVTKKKEKALEELKRTEEEQSQLEKDIKAKEDKIAKERGDGFKGDFNQYVSDLKNKKTKYRKIKEELTEIQNEISVLSRTEQILKQKKDQYDQLLKQQEAKQGIIGFSNTKEQIEYVSEQKEQLDEQKGKTLQEISKIVEQLQQKIDEKRQILQPKLKDLKTLRTNYENVEAEWKQKKQEYDSNMLGTDSELSNLENEVKKLKDEAYKEDTKIQLIKYNTLILELKSQRLDEEGEYKSGKKQFSNENKTYSEYFVNKAAKLEGEIKELRKQRDIVKENHEPALKQQQLFSDLKKLLQLKKQTSQNDQQGKTNVNVNYGGGNVNRLVID